MPCSASQVFQRTWKILKMTVGRSWMIGTLARSRGVFRRACKGRGADREDALLEQKLGLHVRPVSGADANGEIDIRMIEINKLDRGIDPDLQVGVRLLEMRQPPHQPLGRKNRGHGDGEQISLWLLRQGHAARASSRKPRSR